jgi:hypothetical protein
LNPLNLMLNEVALLSAIEGPKSVVEFCLYPQKDIRNTMRKLSLQLNYDMILQEAVTMINQA